MYKFNKGNQTELTSVEVVEGETIEEKVHRIVNNNEPIEGGAPEIFTERKAGVISAYNIRTDKWDIAAEAMDKATASEIAKRDNKIGHKDEVSKAISGDNNGVESIQGKVQETKNE